MRRITLIAILVMSAGLGPAWAFDTPEALIKAVYAPYSTPSDKFDWQDYDETVLRSKELNDLFAKDAAETGDGEMGRLDFDPYIDGQDYELSHLKIGKPSIKGSKAQIEVTFENMGLAEDLMYSLVKESDGWKVDDVVSSNKDFPYSLKAIMSGPLPDDSED